MCACHMWEFLDKQINRNMEGGSRRETKPEPVFWNREISLDSYHIFFYNLLSSNRCLKIRKTWFFTNLIDFLEVSWQKLDFSRIQSIWLMLWLNTFWVTGICIHSTKIRKHFLNACFKMGGQKRVCYNVSVQIFGSRIPNAKTAIYPDYKIYLGPIWTVLTF